MSIHCTLIGVSLMKEHSLINRLLLQLNFYYLCRTQQFFDRTFISTKQVTRRCNYSKWAAQQTATTTEEAQRHKRL